MTDFDGTKGERPVAAIVVERDGSAYQIRQTIEPVYGVVVGISCGSLMMNVRGKR